MRAIVFDIIPIYTSMIMLKGAITPLFTIDMRYASQILAADVTGAGFLAVVSAAITARPTPARFVPVVLFNGRGNHLPAVQACAPVIGRIVIVIPLIFADTVLIVVAQEASAGHADSRCQPIVAAVCHLITAVRADSRSVIPVMVVEIRFLSTRACMPMAAFVGNPFVAKGMLLTFITTKGTESILFAPVVYFECKLFITELAGKPVAAFVFFHIPFAVIRIAVIMTAQCFPTRPASSCLISVMTTLVAAVGTYTVLPTPVMAHPVALYATVRTELPMIILIISPGKIMIHIQVLATDVADTGPVSVMLANPPAQRTHSILPFMRPDQSYFVTIVAFIPVVLVIPSASGRPGGVGMVMALNVLATDCAGPLCRPFMAAVIAALSADSILIAPVMVVSFCPFIAVDTDLPVLRFIKRPLPIMIRIQIQTANIADSGFFPIVIAGGAAVRTDSVSIAPVMGAPIQRFAAVKARMPVAIVITTPLPAKGMRVCAQVRVTNRTGAPVHSVMLTHISAFLATAIYPKMRYLIIPFTTDRTRMPVAIRIRAPFVAVAMGNTAQEHAADATVSSLLTVVTTPVITCGTITFFIPVVSRNIHLFSTVIAVLPMLILVPVIPPIIHSVLIVVAQKRSAACADTCCQSAVVTVLRLIAAIRADTVAIAPVVRTEIILFPTWTLFPVTASVRNPFLADNMIAPVVADRTLTAFPVMRFFKQSFSAGTSTPMVVFISIPVPRCVCDRMVMSVQCFPAGFADALHKSIMTALIAADCTDSVLCRPYVILIIGHVQTTVLTFEPMIILIVSLDNRVLYLIQIFAAGFTDTGIFPVMVAFIIANCAATVFPAMLRSDELLHTTGAGLPVLCGIVIIVTGAVIMPLQNLSAGVAGSCFFSVMTALVSAYRTDTCFIPVMFFPVSALVTISAVPLMTSGIYIPIILMRLRPVHAAILADTGIFIIMHARISAGLANTIRPVMSAIVYDFIAIEA